MLRPEKGVDTLLRAFAKISPANAMLLVVGSGPEESRLKQLALEIGIGTSCHFEPATADERSGSVISTFLSCHPEPKHSLIRLWKRWHAVVAVLLPALVAIPS